MDINIHQYCNNYLKVMGNIIGFEYGALLTMYFQGIKLYTLNTDNLCQIT